MSVTKKKKLKALSKIGIGTVRMGSSVATAFGMGLMGRYLRSAPPILRQQVARFSFQGGLNMFKEGWRELHA